MLDLAKLSDKTIHAARRCAKTRLYAFFRDPKAMIALREEAERRCLVEPGLTEEEFGRVLREDAQYQRAQRKDL